MSTPPIERLEPSHRARCMDLAERVGWPRETTKWDLFFELGPGFGVFAGDRSLDAMVMIPAHRGASFVAMMVVSPDRQGCGLGRSLLAHALADAQPNAMLYATAAGEPLYAKLGFIEVGRVVKCIGALRERTEMSAGLRLARSGDDAAIERADAEAFGFDRSAMLRALVVRAERVVVDDQGGFAVRWHNGHLTVVGPVVAATERAAIALVDAALVGAMGELRVDVSITSDALVAHVIEIGIGRRGEAPLMARPAARSLGDRARYHAIALQGLG